MHVKSDHNARVLKNTSVFETFLANGLLIALAFVLVPSVAQARIRWVGDNPLCDASTVQAAINQSSSGDEVRITKDHPFGEWHAQALSINSKNITIGGNWDYCFQPDSQYVDGYMVLSGYGGAAAPVITIRGNSNVRLYGLNISLGDPPPDDDDAGGGISFRGRGSLYLRVVILDYNTGRAGGAINAYGDWSELNDPPSLTVDLGDNVYISDNTATYGGGIYLRGKAKLNMKAAYTLLHRNHAAQGGAIFIGSLSVADIGSPDSTGGGVGVFYQNSATDKGGAIYAVARAGDVVNLYSTSIEEPLSFVGNQAPAGAMIWVARGEVCATHINVRGNIATGGGGIISVVDPYGSFSVNSSDCLYQLPEDAAGCPSLDQGRCDIYSGNSALSGGKLFSVASGGNIYVRRARMRGNATGFVLRAAESSFNGTTVVPSSLEVVDSVIDHNAVIANLASVVSGAQTVLTHVTIADNSLDASNASVFANSGGLGLAVVNTIVDQDQRLLSGDLTGVSFRGVLSRNFTGYPGQSGSNVVGVPAYIPGFYRLQPYSDGIDRLFTLSTGLVDPDGTARNVDNTSVPNSPGYLTDIGAYESTATSIPPDADRIFSSSFESP
jgi:predicted outer membrane repeat protein